MNSNVKTSPHLTHLASKVCFAVGNPRSGTTWLYSNLKSHPDVCAPYKGMDFFGHSDFVDKSILYYNHGVNWYLQKFENSGKKCLLDASHNYFSDPNTPKRIFDFNPNAKIILTVRNPIESSFSNYWQLQKTYRLGPSFEQVIQEKGGEFLEPFNIHKYLKGYMDLFPKESLLICVFDDLKKDPVGYLKRIHLFLNLSSDGVDQRIAQTKVNQRTTIRFTALRDLQSSLTCFVRQRPALHKMMNYFYQHILPKDLAKKIFALNQKVDDQTYSPMTSREKELLHSYFNEDIQALKSIPELQTIPWINEW